MCDQPVRHRFDHAGALEHADEHSGGEHHRHHRDDARRVSGDRFLLLLDVREVHGQRDRGGHREQHRHRQHVHHQHDQQSHGQNGVEPEQFRSQRRPLGVEPVHEPVRVVIGSRTTGTTARPRRVPVPPDAIRLRPEPAATSNGSEVRTNLPMRRRSLKPSCAAKSSTTTQTDHQRGNHRDEDVGRRNAKRRGRPRGRPAPRKDVHHAVRQAGDDREHHRAHLEFQVERQQSGRHDDERRRPVTVQRHHHGQNGRPDNQAHRDRCGRSAESI